MKFYEYDVPTTLSGSEVIVVYQNDSNQATTDTKSCTLGFVIGTLVDPVYMRNDTGLNSKSISELSDVSVSGSVAIGQVLKWDGTNWVNGNDDSGSLDSINDAGDVVITGTPLIGQVLKWDGTNWVNGVVTSGATNLDGLSDVVISGSPTTGQVLWYNGTNWQNNTVTFVAALNDLTDVTLSLPTTNHVLLHDGTDWKNVLLRLSILSDVALVGLPIANQVLKHNGTNWVNAGISASEISVVTSLFNGLLSGTEDTVQKALNKLDDVNASVLSVSTATFNGLLTSAEDTVQKALNKLDDVSIPSSASQLSTTTTNFNGILTATEDNIQKALDKLDDINASSLSVVTTSFDGILSATENTIQKALDKLDDTALSSLVDVLITEPIVEGMVLQYINDDWVNVALSADFIATNLVNFNGVLSAADDNVQKALETLDGITTVESHLLSAYHPTQNVETTDSVTFVGVTTDTLTGKTSGTNFDINTTGDCGVYVRSACTTFPFNVTNANESTIYFAVDALGYASAQSGFYGDNIQSKTANTNLTLGVNGVGNVVVNAPLQVQDFEIIGSGDFNIESNSNIILDAANAVVVWGSPFRAASLTTTERDALTAVNGDIIYNSTLNRFQGYENGTWVNLGAP